MGKRMTVDLSEQVERLLAELAESEDRSKTEVLRRAIGLYSYLDKQMRDDAAGNAIAVIDKDGKVVKQLKWI
jgi:predicted transcriptional regulator